MLDVNVALTGTEPSDNPSHASRQGYGLTVCLLWNRLLIHRKTIRALGYPGRVRLLINPDTRHFCVQGCDEKEACSFLVPREMAPVYDPFYIHSKFLLGQIYSMMDWNPGLSYRVFGKINTLTQVMDFDLNRYVLVHGDEHLENDELPEELMQANPRSNETQTSEVSVQGSGFITETQEEDIEADGAAATQRAYAQLVSETASIQPPSAFVGSLFDSVRLPGGAADK